jgi:A/G-specific adenine glycosylase
LLAERVTHAIAPALLDWFATAGRAGLPWRTDRAPYRIVVAEFMLQQTQVERVVPIFDAFVAAWPTFAALAAATQADVVRAWRGLGYNSRAVRLRSLARNVVENFGGELPRSDAELRSLPGVGPYTAAAIRAFAFNGDVAAVDTNLRRIVHRTQLGLEWPPLVSVAELDRLANALVPAGNGYAFNSALMDLGATICTARAPKCLLCPLGQTCAAAPIDPVRLRALAASHAPQKTPQDRIAFARTTRYVRGRIVDRLRALPTNCAISLLDLHGSLDVDDRYHDRAAVEAILARLIGEGVVERSGDGLRLAH